ncbi:hypothetical protein DMA15_28650 [Streptomyces sp. WAC 01529]|uniref:hypothetical protein n=1 Tax=Streptomyces sp. WAC 01529 TaxID=2203205 RepID=UPI000F6C1147|nr:hypothetical protein [Streptomyces sp. WAC 01529]AZM56074.1 hypothetical protein DMA15_28650 [Streptomyces sp. WAC 01529]
MTSFDIGRLCAIVKILDKASTHLRVAAVECAAAGAVPAGAGVTGAGMAESVPAGAGASGASGAGTAGSVTGGSVTARSATAGSAAIGSMTTGSPVAGPPTAGSIAGGFATGIPPQGPDPTATGIDVLLKVSEHASGGVRRALLHIRNGEAQRAQHELDVARAETSGAAFAPAGLPRPLPPRVTTALRLMLGITGFFPSETEQVLVRAAVQ